MPETQLTRVKLPGGTVGVTTCAAPQLGDIPAAAARLSDLREALRIIPLGDRQLHPISWLWPRQPKLAACLPDAFSCVLIELRQWPDEHDDVTHLRTFIQLLGHQVELLQELRTIDPPPFLPRLAPPNQQAGAVLQSAIESASANPDRTASIAAQAGLLLMNDCLDESHACSQSIEGEGRNGDYWHAIMHRREPDYGNAKYWFRQVRRHPVFERLPGIATRVMGDRRIDGLDRLTAGDWDPFHFVDLCERHARNEESPAALALREIQGWEMALLLDQSVQA
jgi:hypothetical protein